MSIVPEYRKSGRTRRVELIRGRWHRLEVFEEGVAFERGYLLETRSSQPPSSDLACPDPEAIDEVVSDIIRRVEAPVEIEALRFLQGTAGHFLLDAEGERRWSETFVSLRLTLVERRSRSRSSLQLGSTDLSSLPLVVIDQTVAALARVDVEPAGPADALKLNPQVAAALWPALLHTPPQSLASVGSVVIEQGTNPAFIVDGTGREITRRPILDSRTRLLDTSWPNLYRPSYRSRPRPLPFHLEATAQGADKSAATAVALLAPFHRRGNEIAVELLCSSATRSFRQTLGWPAHEWIRRVRSTGDERIWFPFLAGSYGGETIIDMT